MVRTITEIMMRAMSAAEYDNRAILSVSAICKKIKQWFRLPRESLCTIYQSVKYVRGLFC
jgi:hypothetical protein